jgi:hypothetical protein
MSETKTEYGIVFEAPAPARRGRGGDLYKTLAALAEDGSGEWARVASCKSRSGANSILTAIRSERRRVPTEYEFEYTCRTDSETDTSVLYARFVGLTEATDEATA